MGGGKLVFTPVCSLYWNEGYSQGAAASIKEEFEEAWWTVRKGRPLKKGKKSFESVRTPIQNKFDDLAVAEDDEEGPPLCPDTESETRTDE